MITACWVFIGWAILQSLAVSREHVSGLCQLLKHLLFPFLCEEVGNEQCSKMQIETVIRTSCEVMFKMVLHLIHLQFKIKRVGQGKIC